MPEMCDELIAEAIFAIDDYLDDMVRNTDENWLRFHLDEASYTEWAAEEIKNRILRNPLSPPYEIIEYYIMEMTHYISESNNSESTFMFEVCRETAEDLLSRIDVVLYGENQ